MSRIFATFRIGEMDHSMEMTDFDEIDTRNGLVEQH